MWKLIDCGTYPWFVLEKQKYFHCVYALNGEYKKLNIKFHFLKYEYMILDREKNVDNWIVEKDFNT